MTPKQHILHDIKIIAAKLHRAPTRDEYFGRNCKRLGKYSEHAVRLAFKGSFSNALKEAGLSGVERMEITDKAGLKVAEQASEISHLKNYINDLEDGVLSASKMRSLIGSVDHSRLGESTEWLKGARELKGSLTGIPTLFISDIHFDEVVKSEQVNFVNEYNHEIAVTRIKHTFQTAVDLLKGHMAKPKYDGFILALGGDILSGNIHEELAETNDQRINQSIFDISDLLIDGIEGLANEFGKVFVPCVAGNHGRQHKKPRYKYKMQDNYEWLVYNIIARHFKSDHRVSFLIPDAPDAQWTVYGRTYNLNHGDQFKGGSGISGVFSPLMLGMARKQKKQNAIGQPFDVMMNGHWHQYIHTDSLIINGSVKGYDEFANGHNFNFEPPQQALFINHPTKRETFRMPILCDAVSKQLAKSRGKLSW